MDNFTTLKKQKGKELITILKRRPTIDIVEVKSLVSKGLDLNAQDSDGKTALMISLKNFRLDLCEYFITRICDLTIQDKNGKSVHEYISQAKESKIFKNGYVLCPDRRQAGEMVYINKVENWVNLMSGQFDKVIESILNIFMIIDEKQKYKLLPKISYNKFAEIMELNIILPKRFPKHVGVNFNKSEEVKELDKELMDLYNKITIILKGMEDKNLQSIFKLPFSYFLKKDISEIEEKRLKCKAWIKNYLNKKVEEVYDSEF